MCSSYPTRSLAGTSVQPTSSYHRVQRRRCTLARHCRQWKPYPQFAWLDRRHPVRLAGPATPVSMQDSGWGNSSAARPTQQRSGTLGEPSSAGETGPWQKSHFLQFYSKKC
eukprot:920831-Amphidinium_carterae.1